MNHLQSESKLHYSLIISANGYVSYSIENVIVEIIIPLYTYDIYIYIVRNHHLMSNKANNCSCTGPVKNNSKQADRNTLSVSFIQDCVI